MSCRCFSIATFPFADSDCVASHSDIEKLYINALEDDYSKSLHALSRASAILRLTCAPRLFHNLNRSLNAQATLKLKDSKDLDDYQLRLPFTDTSRSSIAQTNEGNSCGITRVPGPPLSLGVSQEVAQPQSAGSGVTDLEGAPGKNLPGHKLDEDQI